MVKFIMPVMVLMADMMVQNDDHDHTGAKVVVFTVAIGLFMLFMFMLSFSSLLLLVGKLKCKANNAQVFCSLIIHVGDHFTTAAAI